MKIIKVILLIVLWIIFPGIMFSLHIINPRTDEDIQTAGYIAFGLIMQIIWFGLFALVVFPIIAIYLYSGG